jgi:hypothetical protein
MGEGRGARVLLGLSAALGCFLGIALFSTLSGGSMLGYVLAGSGGSALGLIIAVVLLKAIWEISEFTGLSGEESRFPRLRKFFDSFTLRNEL